MTSLELPNKIVILLGEDMEDKEKMVLIYWTDLDERNKTRDKDFANPVPEAVAIEYCDRLNSIYKKLFWFYEEVK
jgi:hypothetical protein